MTAPESQDSRSTPSGSDPGARPTMLTRLGPTGLLGLFWCLMPAVAGIYLLVKLGPVSDWLREHGTSGLAVYMVAFMVSSGFGLLPTYAQSILGGWVFGFALGWPAALAGFAGGALIGYGIAKTVSRHQVEQVITENPKARAIRDALIGHGFWKTLGIVTLLRLPPNSPFALTNLVMASTGVPILPYLGGTVLGMLPRTGVAVGIAAVGAAKARDLQELVKSQGTLVTIAGIVMLVVVLAIIGKIANKALERVNAAQGTERAKDAPAA